MILALLALTLLAALLAAGLSFASLIKAAPGVPSELMSRLERLEAEVGRTPGALREEVRALSGELHGHFGRLTTAHETRFSAFSREVGEGHGRLGQVLKDSTDAFGHTQTTRLGETNASMKELRERLEAQGLRAEAAQKAALDGVAAKVEAMTRADTERQEKLRETLSASLEQLRRENEAKLEQMRATVDEKLQGTLEKRLGESFQIVSDRLELVHKGLGEMQTLATGVGDLKRVLTNVKSRGGWGEVQLGMLLEDMLTPDQFASNVAVQPGSAERVEYAVKLPGKGEGEPLWLPIDAKFPHEDYDRLLTAQEAGIAEDMERAALALERAVRLQAKTICAKYVHPPHSTDFAIMYLPTEGLFAEVIRRPGLMMELQQNQRVMITGPTTLSAILNSLQMGFRSVAIEKRSSEVWQVLGKAKAEFRKYGEVWDRLGKQLAAAQNTVADGGKRTRALERSLRQVETVELVEGSADLLSLPGVEEEDEAA
ncbi:DNA recombination protein RmuC [Caulobacter sp. S45]|uniref:DNA recombination protein RmuC n=1 Tax=Caulobacter sp. S45 TaxID=1641861 RepID=UPI0015758AD2|nr:DNA recombination protein RmuC [Caulobacter sp. S45]